MTDLEFIWIENKENHITGDTVIMRRKEKYKYEDAMRRIIIDPNTGLPVMPEPKTEYQIVDVAGGYAKLKKVRDFWMKTTMKSKRPEIDNEVAVKVQRFANENHDGNFTLAVNELLRAKLADLARPKPRFVERGRNS